MCFPPIKTVEALRRGASSNAARTPARPRRAFVDVLDLAPLALFLSVVASGWATGDQSREMHGNARRCHGDEFRFDRRVARRDEEAQARTPSLHERTSKLRSFPSR
jgi:hypothetical protein